MNHPSVEIILVRTAIAENVGMVLRSMKAFGVQNLTLVNPSFTWDEEGPAWKTACGARDRLAQVKRCSSLKEAAAHCHRVIGFSRRTHDFARPQMDLVSWFQSLRNDPSPGTAALVFGSEDQGLSNDDKRLCDTLVNIPLHSKTLSLNLAQAVTVVLYEMSRTEDTGETTVQGEDDFPIEHQDAQRAMQKLAALLDNTGYFKEGRRWYQEEILRNLIYRLRLTRVEYNTVMGVLSALDRTGKT